MLDTRSAVILQFADLFAHLMGRNIVRPFLDFTVSAKAVGKGRPRIRVCTCLYAGKNAGI